MTTAPRGYRLMMAAAIIVATAAGIVGADADRRRPPGDSRGPWAHADSRRSSAGSTSSPRRSSATRDDSAPEGPWPRRRRPRVHAANPCGHVSAPRRVRLQSARRGGLGRALRREPGNLLPVALGRPPRSTTARRCPPRLPVAHLFSRHSAIAFAVLAVWFWVMTGGRGHCGGGPYTTFISSWLGLVAILGLRGGGESSSPSGGCPRGRSSRTEWEDWKRPLSPRAAGTRSLRISCRLLSRHRCGWD